MKTILRDTQIYGIVTYLLLFRNAFLDEHVSLKRAKNNSLKCATTTLKV